MSPRISCIVLSSDSHINKGSSVLASIYSLILQDFDNFEIILVENSTQKPDIKLLESKFITKIEQLNKNIAIKVLNLKNSDNSYGEARNRGAKEASAETLVFIDDDTIVLNNSSLKTINKLAEKYDFGFGAVRNWTKDEQFQQTSNDVLKDLFSSNSLDKIATLKTSPPEVLLEKSYDEILLTRTFISNFGFCRREAFWKVGGYISFPGYGFEDDHLAFKLYKAGYRVVMLDELEVLHVTHGQLSTKPNNLPYYFKELVKQGYFWFHIIDLIKDPSNPKKKILEEIRCVHQNEKLLKAYDSYISKEPLNRVAMGTADFEYWEVNNRYNLLEYTQEIAKLLNSHTIDGFIKTSSADFDNLCPVVQSAQDSGLIELGNNNEVKPIFDFKHTAQTNMPAEEKLHIEPDSSLNQFPCDLVSRERRLNLIRDRYPYCEYLRLGIIGDDDFISTEFINDVWVQPIVLEKDPRIIKKIKNKMDYVQIYSIDIMNKEDLKEIPKVGSFITDPPYTLNGSLAFISTGLQILDTTDEREFYVIMNCTMIGKRLKDIQKILSDAGVYLVNIIENFSQYKLPKNFEENTRATALFSKIEYSSSSDLYIFKTNKPDIRKIEAFIDLDNLYNHYV